ncbi:hypothetical protein CALVIDRAFT_539889 [Calocera viscosa TUFC12733]|uniref:DUF803-domain-containing protein n=1 Tax=Calocera viscosa (strain TUFC12733) TaxID=1330018 RepID=A0A167JC16_CALVF|nr:hypothetical protein CALVIDRAFT_539889 [Calocera viscosa TUFC12733]
MAPAQIPIWAGILVGVISSLIQSLGLTIQRKSHLLNDALPPHQQRPDWRRPLWLFGFGIFISTNFLGSVFQIASLPVVILAPLGAISLLWNAIFARLLLSDPFTLLMSLGTALVSGGAVLVGIFGVVPTPTHSLDALIALFSRPAFLAYFSVVLSITGPMLVLTHIVEWRYKAARRADRLALLSADPAEVSERSHLLPLPALAPYTPAPPTVAQESERIFIALSYAVLSGTLSALGLLFAKAGVELLVLTLGGDNQFWRWQAWLLVPGLVTFGLSQLWYLQKSLEFADPTLICPLAFCMFNISSILDSLIYFDQFRRLSALQLSMILLGTFLLLAGVWILSLQSSKGVQLGTGLAEPALLTQEPESYAEQAEEEEEEPMSPSRRFMSLLTPSTIGQEQQGGYTNMNPLPGFAIGLAPTSPGFILSPPRRKRTLTLVSTESAERAREREVDGLPEGVGEHAGGRTGLRVDTGSKHAGEMGVGEAHGDAHAHAHGQDGRRAEDADADAEGGEEGTVVESEGGEVVQEKRGWWVRWGGWGKK